MRRLALVLAPLALVATGVPALTADAATRFTRVSLEASVDGASVSVSTSVKASVAVVAEQYGVCVRDAQGRNLDFAPKATGVSLGPVGTPYAQRRTFPVGTFTYFPCVRANGAWNAVDAPKTFTVAAPTTTSPSPSATPTVPPPPPSTPTTPTSPPAPPSPTPGPGTPSATSSPTPGTGTPSATSSPTPGTGTPSATTSPSPSAPKVLFSDTFDGTGAYDRTKWGEWSACTYNGTAAYGRIGCGDRARLDGAGHLVLPATPTQGTSLSTGDRFRFTYGTITARMKIPKEVGYWPAFWTLNSNPSGTGPATVGEVDVIEAYTTWSDGYRRATHNYTPAGTWSAADDPLCAGVNIQDSWHDYSAKIEPGQVTFYFDGKQCGPVERRDDPESGGKPYAFGPDNPAGNWLLLTMAVGGAGGQQKPATSPSELLVDSVTVTALPGSA